MGSGPHDRGVADPVAVVAGPQAEHPFDEALGDAAVGRQDPVDAILTLTEGRGADVAFETAGNGKALQAAVGALRRGGRLSVVGLPAQGDIALNIPFIVDNEIVVSGVFRYANTYPDGIRFLASGLADVDAMVTDRYSLEDTWDAMERALTARSETLKVMVYPNGI